MAYQTADVINLMESSTSMKIDKLSVDGGATSNNLLLSFQADILGTTVLRPECIETTALGAAYLAGLATGVYKSTDEIKKNRRISKTFSPDKNDAWREDKMAIWKRAVARSLDWK
jgi:glycerol kinase